MNETSLFSIEVELRSTLEQALDESPEAQENREIMLSTLADAILVKTDQIAHYRESMKNYLSLLDAKIDELKERRDQIEKKMERFDDYILNCMEINGKDSFEGSFCKIKKRKPSQAVEIIDESLIPIDYIKIPEPKPQIMKAEIAKALKAGAEIAGARLIDGKTSIQYSIK